MYKHLSFAGVLLALSISSHGQAAITFEECSRAMEAMGRYAAAVSEMSQAQLNEELISSSKYLATIASLDEFKSTYTLNECMAGQHTNVYQCFAGQKGDLAVCR